MRLYFLAFLGLGLACGGGSDPAATPGDGATPGARPTSAASPAGGASTGAPARPTSALDAVGSPADAQLADHWLVILGSKADPAEVIPGVDGIRAEPGVAVRQLLSSRFKNLMPCYAVTVATATPDKKAALALATSLRAKGVDNYVKNAGSWVGPSAAIDAYCAAADAPVTDDVRVATRVGETLWVPVATTDAELTALTAAAPPPVSESDRYDAWRQPLAGGSGQQYTLVDAANGVTQVCSSDAVALLTLGTPHFGVLQGEEKPSAPACGSPARFERLACPQSVTTGAWVAVPAEAKVGTYSPLGPATALEADARTILADRTDWDAEPANFAEEDGPVERTVKVTRWRGPAGEVAVVEGRRAWGNGVCGGGDDVWFGVFATSGDTLGAALGEIQAESFAEVSGLVDLGADGRPDLVLSRFPTTVTVVGADGQTATSLAIDFCDCAC